MVHRLLKVCGFVLAAALVLAGGQARSADVPAEPTEKKVDITQPGAYRSGMWEYKVIVTSPGSKSEGLHGKLFYSGKPVPEAQPGDYYQTPWGEMQWAGDSEKLWGDHGWVLRRKDAKGGKLLAEPWKEMGGPVVMAMVLVDGEETPKGIAPWVSEEMSRLGVKKFKVQRDWFPLNDQACTIHDTKMLGRMAVRLTPARDAEKLTIAIEGNEAARIDLARKDGVTKLLQRPMGVVDTMNFYLAFRVERSAVDWPKPTEVAADSDGKEVVLKGAREVVISLPGDARSGLVWSIAKVQGDSPRGSSVVVAGEPQFDSARGVYENYLRVAATGKSFIEMECKRPWQTDKPPEKTFKVTIDVKELAK